MKSKFAKFYYWVSLLVILLVSIQQLYRPWFIPRGLKKGIFYRPFSCEFYQNLGSFEFSVMFICGILGLVGFLMLVMKKKRAFFLLVFPCLGKLFVEISSIRGLYSFYPSDPGSVYGVIFSWCLLIFTLGYVWKFIKVRG